ncbi:MAG: phosphodiesterase [Pontimonas sp.]
MSQPLSQHPQPHFSILHVSDTHLLGGSKPLHGSIDTAGRMHQMFQRISASNLDIRALVFTGDLADRAEEDAYQELKSLVEPHARALSAEVVWVMGNHDEREPFSTVLWGESATSEPRDRSYDIDGLRIIALDTSVPGYHHGELTDEQLAWLAAELSQPAPRGTVLALHHPPIPTVVPLMGLIELEEQHRLWEVITGSDVRGILAGHLHYSTHTVARGIPVSVAAAACYNVDIAADASVLLKGVDRAHGSSLVSVYDDQLVFSDIPATDMPELFSHSSEHLPMILNMSHDERRAMFSAKDSDYNKKVDKDQAGE